MKKQNNILVIGGGLAGCEAAYQIARAGIKVDLFEMKPKKHTPAHKSDYFAELVCSNSFRADNIENAVGLLKEELRALGSLIMECAEATKLPAGGALAVDREEFARLVSEKIHNHPNITVINEEVDKIPDTTEQIVIVATGPLTSEELSRDIKKYFNDKGLYFFDAAAPIVEADSIDMSNAFFASRYGHGDGNDYINCPMDKDEYALFYNELINAKVAELHSFDNEELKVFSGCMPVEVMAASGEQTLLYGPLKPVGLTNPHTGHEAHAVVQLRRDNSSGTLYNIVGFQTHLTFGEQKRVFSLIPALKNANFVRYGVMHRNTFINSPQLLNEDFSTRKDANLYFAGQITGVEGYIESTSSGFVAGINAARKIKGQDSFIFGDKTAIGALANYISHYNGSDFQPMNVNFGIIASYQGKIKEKRERNLLIAKRSLDIIEGIRCNVI